MGGTAKIEVSPTQVRQEKSLLVQEGPTGLRAEMELLGLNLILHDCKMTTVK